MEAPEFIPSSAVAARPEVRAVLSEIDAIEDRTRNYRVVTAGQYTAGADDLKAVKAAQKKLEATRTSITVPMNQALKAVLDLFRTPGDRLASIERTIKAQLARYADEQERIRQEEQRKADAEAQRERDRMAELSRKAAEAGRTAAAEKHEERAAQVVAPIITREAPKVAGVAMREVWKFQVERPELVPREYLAVDESKIGAYVRAMKADARIPGVRIYPEKQVAAGSR